MNYNYKVNPKKALNLWNKIYNIGQIIRIPKNNYFWEINFGINYYVLINNNFSKKIFLKI